MTVQGQKDNVTIFTHVHFLHRGWQWFSNSLSQAGVSLHWIMQAAWIEYIWKATLSCEKKHVAAGAGDHLFIQAAILLLFASLLHAHIHHC